MLENVAVPAISEGLGHLAGRQGVFSPISGNPNEDGRVSRKPRGASNLAFSSSFVGFRLFASIFVLCQRNDTRNDTRRERLEFRSAKTYMDNFATSSNWMRAHDFSPQSR